MCVCVCGVVDVMQFSPVPSKRDYTELIHAFLMYIYVQLLGVRGSAKVPVSIRTTGGSGYAC